MDGTIHKEIYKHNIENWLEVRKKSTYIWTVFHLQKLQKVRFLSFFWFWTLQYTSNVKCVLMFYGVPLYTYTRTYTMRFDNWCAIVAHAYNARTWIQVIRRAFLHQILKVCKYRALLTRMDVSVVFQDDIHIVYGWALSSDIVNEMFRFGTKLSYKFTATLLNLHNTYVICTDSTKENDIIPKN